MSSRDDQLRPALITPDNVVDGIVGAIRNVVNNMTPRFLQATFVSAESDAALSEISSEGITHHNVRKLSDVPTLVGGNALLVLHAPGIPLIILGVITGNIADVDETIPP